MKRILCLLVLLGCPFWASSEEQTPKLTMGNGQHNHVQVNEASRDDNVLTFKEVKIATNGWLVVHPFENGKPNGDKYVGATFVAKGINRDVSVEIYKGITSGEMFIVMLDKAVFEGSTMVAHVFRLLGTWSASTLRQRATV